MVVNTNVAAAKCIFLPAAFLGEAPGCIDCVIVIVITITRKLHPAAFKRHCTGIASSPFGRVDGTVALIALEPPAGRYSQHQ